MRPECYFCHLKTVEKLIGKFNSDPAQTESFILSIHELLYHNWQMTNPELATRIHRLAREKLNHNNLYLEEKHKANQLLLGQYKDWKSRVDSSDNPLKMAAKLAVIGNIIDYGAHSVADDITDQINTLLSDELVIDDTQKLAEGIRQAESVFYIGDNAGEIVFDKLFIETMQHPNITFAVRGKPVLNDVTVDDTIETSLKDICHIVSSGSDSPSTILEYCSEEFIFHFRKADLIIAKGQGNFEGLMNCNRNNLFFLLIAKCNPMAELLGVQSGSMIIKESNSKNYAL